MRHLSLFTGIGGIDLGFERAGMVTVGQVENDAKCVSVLERWWPDVRRWDDVRTFRPGRDAADVVSGGFPCQDVSVAGKRAGLAGERTGLWWQFRRIVAECRPSWVVAENVPGLLSSNGGRDFAAILGGLGELGYSMAWRVLDAQWFGVAQRRRRVFIVGHLGDRPPHEVLDLAQGCCGDTPPSRTAGESPAPTLAARTRGGGFPGSDDAANGCVVPVVAGTLGRADGGRTTDLDGHGAYIPFAHNQRDEVRTLGDLAVAVSSAQSGTHRQETLLAQSGVRRLTPVECARLQGFPDNWNDQTITQRTPAILIGESEARWLCKHAEYPAASDPLLTGHSTLVSCTTSDGIGTGLLIYPLDPDTCHAPSVADLAALRVLGDGAAGATRHGGGLATQRNRSGGIVSARPIAKATSTGDDGSSIGSLWKINLDGLSNAARLFIMSTWTYRTIALRTSGSAPTQNTLRFTTDSIRFVPNSCGGASFGLMLVATRSLSDTHRYRQYGNAVCVPVAEWVGRRIVGLR